MATVIVCDGGCGAQSPDPKTGLHEANHWLVVRAKSRRAFDQASKYDDLMFCKSCSPRIIAALKSTAAQEGGE